MRIFKDTLFMLGVWFINLVSPDVAGRILFNWGKIRQSNSSII